MAYLKFDDNFYLNSNEMFGLGSYMGEHKVIFKNGQFKVVSKEVYDRLLKLIANDIVDLTESKIITGEEIRG